MNLPGAIIYYTGSFLLTVVCAVAGVFLGKTLRKRKNQKAAQEK